MFPAVKLPLQQQCRQLQRAPRNGGTFRNIVTESNASFPHEERTYFGRKNGAPTFKNVWIHESDGFVSYGTEEKADEEESNEEKEGKGNHGNGEGSPAFGGGNIEIEGERGNHDGVGEGEAKRFSFIKDICRKRKEAT